MLEVLEWVLETVSAGDSNIHFPFRSKVTRVTNTSELAALKKNHSVVFMIVHDQKIDVDWQRIYMKQANDKALKAKFAVTTNPDIVEVLHQDDQ